MVFPLKDLYRTKYQAHMKEKKYTQILGNQENNASLERCTMKHRVEHRTNATQVDEALLARCC